MCASERKREREARWWAIYVREEGDYKDVKNIAIS